jgi:hypothetical protein
MFLKKEQFLGWEHWWGPGDDQVKYYSATDQPLK